MERTYQPVPVAAGESGLWRAVALSEPKPNPMVEAYHLLAASIREGSSHPMHAENAIVGFELLMGIFESARLRTKIRFPLAQERYPLDMMIEP